MIQVYTGNGKGKTTAAIGVTMRTVGIGGKVFFGQFMKQGEYAEHKIFAQYALQITHKQFGSGKFVMGKPSEEDRALAMQGWQACLEAIDSGRYNLVVMDELNLVINLELVPIDDVLRAITDKKDQLEMIITGRNAHEGVVAAADLVTEMREVKHYYQQGVQARKGIEF
jgi:cob(I)alamin adenosyltransferase